MQPKQIAMLVAALATIVIAIVVLVSRMGPDPATQDPMATWVCDSCGHEAKAPLENVSEDCPKCADGQLIQRVFYRCTKCSEVFEAYQVNWSHAASRAEAKVAEADRVSPLPASIPRDETTLVRKVGGKWTWRDTNAGRRITRDIACPKCGKGKASQFEKLLDPAKTTK